MWQYKNFEGPNLSFLRLYWTANLTRKNLDYFPEAEKFDLSSLGRKGLAPYMFIPFGGGLACALVKSTLE